MSSDPTPASFDLTSEPWLPVQWRDGTEGALSLREVFAQADRLRRLVGDVPTQEFALLRLLLAILHDVIDGPRDSDQWYELWESGLPVGDIHAYLDRHRGRFDLLHPEEPFYQVAGLRTATGEVSSLDRMVADVPNGALFFTMRARGAERVGFAEAARWLVHAHAFDTSGIKTGAVGDPRVKNGKVYPLGVAWAGNLGGVLVEGNTLRETLLLNLIAFDLLDRNLDPERDLPAWRRPPLGPRQLDETELASRPAGVRDLYTWQSRRIRLVFDAEGVHGVVLAYGDPLEAHNKHLLEPMTGWRRSANLEKKLGRSPVYLPQPHDPSKSAWRGLASLITGYGNASGQGREAAPALRPLIIEWIARLCVLGYLPPGFLIRARLFGAIYGTQQSVIDEMIDDAVAMPVVLLHERDQALGEAAIDAVTKAEEAVTALGDLAAYLARAAGAEEGPPKAEARTRGFAALDGPFRDWLAHLRPGDDPQDKRAEWQRRAHRIISRLGDELLRSAGDAAWDGRTITTEQGRTIWLTAAHADLLFRKALNKALPAAAAYEPKPEPPGGESDRHHLEAAWS